MKKRRVEVVVETHRIWIIRQPDFPEPVWCAGCSRLVRMVTADAAARMVRQSTRTIYAWVEADRLHYRETPEGCLLVCLDSLLSGEAAEAHRTPEIRASLERETSRAARATSGRET
ncbi:MAG: hypothetical protein ICV68_01980 [Pyrinomonadaceae bacterium]|nr:hypothetical protein [Pyrinomonadaceae bacterium]